MPTVPDLKAIFARAAEIAQQVPKNMQEAAFNRAVDLLTSSTHQQAGRKPSGKNPTRTGRSLVETPAKENTSVIDQLLRDIDSTQHPGVTSSTSVRDRALMILQIARNDHNVDGLTPPEIAKILTDKFRIGTSRNAVAMALGGATRFVNRIPSARGFSYRIMAPGEEHLAGLIADDSPSVRPAKSGQRRFRAKGKKNPIAQKVIPKDEIPSSSSPKAKNKTNKAAARNRPISSSSPKTAVLGLIASGFFSKPRTGPEVQEFLKTKKGFNFGIAQVRLVMLRLVRDDKLDRNQNAEGQYEYASP